MSITKKTLLFFVLPFIAPLLFPPELILGSWLAFLTAAILFGALGIFLLRGNPTALTLSIFVQGMNVICRTMMLFPNLSFRGQFNFAWLVTSLLSIALSSYLVLRLDRTDVRVTMVS
jgi:hypothetical protein